MTHIHGEGECESDCWDANGDLTDTAADPIAALDREDVERAIYALRDRARGEPTRFDGGVFTFLGVLRARRASLTRVADALAEGLIDRHD